MGVRSAIVNCRWRRGSGRAVVLLLLSLSLLVAGCGKSGEGAKTDSEKAAEVEQIDNLLAWSLTTIDAYDRALPLLRGELRAVGRQFRGQAQAHADALTKAIRGLGGETGAEAFELEVPAPRSQSEALLSLYEAENTALAQALEAAPQLEFAAPRTLAAVLAGSNAQHLTVLRQGLGLDLAASVPRPFEDGEEPPPGMEEG
jgi:hypothetical protein